MALSLKQSWYLEELRRRSSHPVEVAEEPAEGEGVAVFLVSFPGLYLTLDVNGVILRTETTKQWSESHLQ